VENDATIVVDVALGDPAGGLAAIDMVWLTAGALRSPSWPQRDKTKNQLRFQKQSPSRGAKLHAAATAGRV